MAVYVPFIKASSTESNVKKGNPSFTDGRGSVPSIKVPLPR